MAPGEPRCQADRSPAIANGAALDPDPFTDDSRASSLPTGHDVSLRWHLLLPGELEGEFARYFRDTTRPFIN